MPLEIRSRLAEILELDDSDLMPIDGMLGFESFWELARIDKPSLRFPPFVPHAYEALSGFTLYETIRQGDVLTHQPYDSFRSVEEFVASAARDSSRTMPQQSSSKMTRCTVARAASSGTTGSIPDAAPRRRA